MTDCVHILSDFKQLKAPIPATRKPKGESRERCITITDPGRNFSPDMDNSDRNEIFDFAKKGSRWRSAAEDDNSGKSPTHGLDKLDAVDNPSPRLQDLQEELSRITERHEALKTEAAVKVNSSGSLQVANQLEALKKRKSEPVTPIITPTGHELQVTAADLAMQERSTAPYEPDRFEMCKEDRLWEDLFGKDSDDFSGLLNSPTSHYPLGDDDDKSRSLYSVKMNAMDGAIGTSEPGKYSRGRQSSSVSRRNPFEDLNVNKASL